MNHAPITTDTAQSQEFLLFMQSLRSLSALQEHVEPDIFMISLAQTMINFIPLKTENVVCCPQHVREYIQQDQDLLRVFDEVIESTCSMFTHAKAIRDRNERDD